MWIKYSYYENKVASVKHVAIYIRLHIIIFMLHLAHTWHQSQLGENHAVYNNATTSPIYAVEEQHHLLPWEANTRNASTQKHSGKLFHY